MASANDLTVRARRLLRAAGVLCAATAILANSARGELVEPARDGLVLWLDAGDEASVTRDMSDGVIGWADKSGRAGEARQDDAARRPRWVAEAVGGKPGLRFDGDDFLSLGKPAGLDFRPGEPLTIAVACRAGPGGRGNLIAKAGGGSAQRAYQLYITPSGLGAIAYGSPLHERAIDAGLQVAVLVSDGKRCEAFAGGEPWFSFDAGRGGSDVDVLIGARRATADNTGIAYPLTGDVAEILVYDRALDSQALDVLHAYLMSKYEPDWVERPEDRTPMGIAKRLWQRSQAGHLSDREAATAASLLADDDPFVRGLAEWAIATKVGGENNGEQIVWPGDDPPEWFQRWTALDPEFRIEADYVRQAVTLGVHDDSAALLESAKAAVRRAEAVADEIGRMGTSAEEQTAVAGRVEQLRREFGRLAEQIAEKPDDLPACRRSWLDVRQAARPIALARARVRFDDIVFLARFAPHTVRNITRSFAWKHKPGGDVCVLSGFRDGGRVRPVIAGQLGPGYVWGLDLWWEGDRVVFGFARQPEWPPPLSTVAGDTSYELRKVVEPLHVFEVNVDGTGLRQLTDHPYWSDFEPTYCANGNIVFASDRCARAAECGSFPNDIPNPNLYVMSPDGSNLRRLTDNKDLDRYPHSLDNGLIAYTHWEYQERHFMEVHSIWTVRPDGSMADALYKHHMPAPCSLRDTRSVPGSGKLVAIATGHHTFANGPIVLVDLRHGLNDARGLSILTPGIRPQEGPMAGKPVAEGGVHDAGGLYRTPWAVSPTCFLAGYAYPRVDQPGNNRNDRADANGFGLYLIDVYGNKELLYRDPVLSSSFPIPLAARPRPPLVPGVTTGADGDGPILAARKSGAPPGEAVCYVSNVYDGLEGVARGEVKYLRIAQHVGWPWSPERGKMPYLPGAAGSRHFGYWSWSPVRVIGEVPVEEDGSALFTVPADAAVYFQALDERHMELRRMRSMVSLHSGEVRGCPGCHESRARSAATYGSFPQALASPPQTPTPPPWGADRLVGYERLVQPILDRNCTRCHGAKDPAGGLDFTSTRGPEGFYQSFRTLFGLAPGATEPHRTLVSVANRFSNSSVTQPKQFGSHQSRLIQTLLRDDLPCAQRLLSPNEWLTLVTWIDANAPYHDAFFNKRPPEGDPVRDVVPRLTPSAQNAGTARLLP